MLCTDPLAMPPLAVGGREGSERRAPLPHAMIRSLVGGGVCSQWGCGTDRTRPEARKEKGGPSRARPPSWVAGQSQLWSVSLSQVATLCLQASWSNPQWRTASLGRFLQVLPSRSPQSKASRGKPSPPPPWLRSSRCPWEPEQRQVPTGKGKAEGCSWISFLALW